MPLENVKGDITFEHVSFAYQPESPVLKDVSFHCERGTHEELVARGGRYARMSAIQGDEKIAC